MIVSQRPMMLEAAVGLAQLVKGRYIDKIILEDATSWRTDN